MTETLDVMLWGHKVGTLVGYKDRHAEKFCFYFDPSFRSTGLDIAPIQASVNGPLAKGTLPVYAESGKIYGGLPLSLPIRCPTTGATGSLTSGRAHTTSGPATCLRSTVWPT